LRGLLSRDKEVDAASAFLPAIFTPLVAMNALARAVFCFVIVFRDSNIRADDL